MSNDAGTARIHECMNVQTCLFVNTSVANILIFILDSQMKFFVVDSLVFRVFLKVFLVFF